MMKRTRDAILAAILAMAAGSARADWEWSSGHFGAPAVSNWAAANIWLVDVAGLGSNPGSSDTVHIDVYVNGVAGGLLVAHMPVISSDVGTVNQVLMGIEGGTTSLTIENGGQLNAGSLLRVGHLLGSTATLNMSGGTLYAAFGQIGHNEANPATGGDGIVNLSGTSVLHLGGVTLGQETASYRGGDAEIHISDEAVFMVDGDLTASGDGRADTWIANGWVDAAGVAGKMIRASYEAGTGRTEFRVVLIAESNWDTYADTWAATDALGRTLPDTITTGAPRTNRTVALFYYLWLGAHTTELHDISKIIAQDPNAIHEFNNPLWGAETVFHHWGESLFGYYFMEDEWIIRRHAQMFIDAGIDVIVLDSTNGPDNQYKSTYDKLFNIYQSMLADGYDVPKIVFMTHTDSGTSVQKLYDDIYAGGRHSNLWFHWKGKPLILGAVNELSPTLQSFFTVRHSWAFEPGEDTWGWLEHSPQQGGWTGTPFNLEQVPVATAGHPHDPVGGYGKSYAAGSQPPNGSQPTEQGIQFNEQWQRALAMDPQVVLVTQWNEWTAQLFQSPFNSSYAMRPIFVGDPFFVDAYNEEFNRDIEPMKGGYGDNFYYQLADNIRHYKGTRAVPAASDPATLLLSDFSAWDAVAPEFRDDQNDVYHRGHQGFGTNYYTNTSGRNDIRRCKVARDTDNIYLFLETMASITPQLAGGEYWMNCFIRDETSGAADWEGYQFRLSNENPGSGKLTLLISSGGWNWASLGEVDTEVSGNQLAVSIPRALLGLPTESTFADLSFKWADNQSGTTTDDWLLNGDAAPNARFRYRYAAPNMNTYSAWVEGLGLIDAARTNDPDSDGVNNLAEYAMDGNPMVDDAAIISPSIEISSENLLLVYRRRNDAAARSLIYDLLYKLNLTNAAWISTGGTFETGTEAINLEIDAVTNSISTVGIDAMFLKVNVTEN